MFLKISRWFLYASIFSVVIVISATFFPFIGGKYYFFRTMVSLSAIAWLLWWAFEASTKESGEAIKDLLSRPLFSAVSAFVLSFLLAALFAHNVDGAFWSNFERGEGAFQMLHYYAFFVLAVLTLRTKKDWIWGLKMFLIAACLMILYGVFGFLFLHNQSWFCTYDFKGDITGCNSFISRFITPYQGTPKDQIPKTLSGLFTGTRFQGSLGNPAYVAPYLMFAMAYALFLWLQRRFSNKSLEALFYSLLLICFSFFFLISQTRGAFLGLLAATFFFLVYMTITHKPARKWTGGILLLSVMAMGLLFSLGQTPAIQKLPIGRLFNVGLSEYTAQTRFWTWNTAWQGFKDRPLFGWGPENFSTVFDRHFDQRHFNPKASSETWFDRAHSVLFDYLAETGLFGMLSFVSLFVVFYLQFFGFKILKAEGSKTDMHKENFHLSPWAWGLIGVVPIGYLVQGLVLFDVLPIYINLFFFLALASFIFRTGPAQVNK